MLIQTQAVSTVIHVQLSNWSAVRGNKCSRVVDCRHISEAVQKVRGVLCRVG